MQSLTSNPTIVGGVLRYEDSPLVRAVQEGRVLMVDEADKAPTHVTAASGGGSPFLEQSLDWKHTHTHTHLSI